MAPSFWVGWVFYGEDLLHRPLIRPSVRTGAPSPRGGRRRNVGGAQKGQKSFRQK